jgi:RHS repeat-associated protein
VYDTLTHTTHYGYDLQNRQVSVTDPTGAVSRTGYDAAGNVVSTTDALGHQTINRYDVLGQRVASTDPMSRSTYVQYDLAGNAIRTTDGGGLSTFTVYDALNRAVQSLTLSAAGTYVSNQTVYDPVGNVAQTIDGLGLATTYYYDADNRQIGTKDPLGLTTATTYDLVGNVTSSTYQRGQKTTYVYDVLNREIQVTDPDNNVTWTAYDAVNNAIETVDPKNGVTWTTYDADNRVLSVEDADGYLSQLSYDAVGNVIKSIDENGQVTQTWYDADNRPVLVLDPDGHWTQTAYNALGLVISTTDGAGDVTADGYDADNELTLVQDGDGNETEYGFDQSGRQVDEIDPDNNQTRTVFDTLGDAAVSVDALGNATVQLFDKDGRLVTAIDAAGRMKTYSYDNDGNVLTEKWYNADGSLQQTITYTWDNDGNLLTATNSNGTVTRTYDAAGLLQTQTDVWGLQLTYGYDGNSNVVSVTDSLGGQVTSRYDGDNRLVSRSYSGPNNQQARFDLTYTDAGQVATMTRYADTEGNQKVGFSQWTYDNVGNVKQIQHQDGNGNVLGTFAYGYDAANRVSSETDNGGSPTNYGYDKASQLISAGSTTYGFDANGNRNTSGYQVSADNRLLNDGTCAYQYDNDGNVTLKTNNTTKETWAYTWDDNNQLTLATHKDSSGNLIAQVTLKYDALGQLVEEDVYTQATGQTVVTRHAWDRGNIWADLDGNGNLVTRRLFLDGMTTPAARINADGSVNWYLTDQLGSVRLIVDNTSAVLDASNYDAWGNVISESQPANGDRYGYAGGQRDVTLGLDHFGIRWYYPPAGIWYSPDPLGLLADSNPYRYVLNQPTDLVDPTGEFWWIIPFALAAGAVLYEPTPANAPAPGDPIFTRDSFGATFKGSLEMTTLKRLPGSPALRQGVGWTVAYDVAAQKADQMEASRLGRPVPQYDLRQTVDNGLIFGNLGPPLARYPRASYPLLGLGAASSARQFSQGRYERGAVDLVATGLGGLGARNQLQEDALSVMSLRNRVGNALLRRPTAAGPQVPLRPLSLELGPATVEKLPIPATTVQTPNGPVEVTIYGGGYNPATNKVGLGRFHSHGSELIVDEGAELGNIPGITVTDVPSKGKLFWNNRSASQPAQLTSGQIRAVQQGLEGAFPGREVVFDPNNSKVNAFHAQLKGGE